MGYEGTDEETSWLPASELGHASEVVLDFHQAYPEKPRPDCLSLLSCYSISQVTFISVSHWFSKNLVLLSTVMSSPPLPLSPPLAPIPPTPGPWSTSTSLNSTPPTPLILSSTYQTIPSLCLTCHGDPQPPLGLLKLPPDLHPLRLCGHPPGLLPDPLHRLPNLAQKPVGFCNFFQ